MKSKTSFLNKGIIINDIKTYIWIELLYLISLFFIVPFKILMSSGDKQYVNTLSNMGLNTLKDIFYYKSNDFQGILLLGFPIILGILLFRYLHVKTSSDLIHSLPIKRSTIYRSHILVGMLFLSLPILINGLISMVFNRTLGLEKLFTFYDVGHWMLLSILMTFMFFFLTVCIGMFTGTSLLQGILTVIFLVLPYGFVAILFTNLSFWVYGFTSYSLRAVDVLPFLRIIGANYYGYEPFPGEIQIYGLISLVLCFLAEYIYLKRKLENTNKSIVFSKLNSVFKYGVTACSILFAGFYFIQSQKSIYFIIFGYFVGAILGYFIAEMVIRKSFSFSTNCKGLLIYSSIILITLIGMKFDIIGYEKRMPNPNNVNSIYFSSSYFALQNSKNHMDLYFDKNNLKRIYEFHKKLIEEKSQNKFINTKGSEYQSIIFVYNLKNGGKLKREYRVPQKTIFSSYKNYYKPIEESREYKLMHNDILSANPSDIDKITIANQFHINKGVIITDPKLITEVLSAFNRDLYSETYEQTHFDKRVPFGTISFMTKNNKENKFFSLLNNNNEITYNQLNYYFKDTNKFLYNWLKNNNYLNSSIAFPKDIKEIVVQKVSNREEYNNLFGKRTLSIYGNNKTLRILDKKQIETCLRSSLYSYEETYPRYILNFYLNNGTISDISTYYKANAPDFITHYFDK